MGSAVLFFCFLSLFSVAGAVSFFDFAPLFNDSRQSLKGLNGEEILMPIRVPDEKKVSELIKRGSTSSRHVCRNI